MPKTTAQILREYRGHPLWSFGFRPFFLFAAVFAALAVPLWIIAFLGLGAARAAEFFSRDWHVHEMLFGYAGAVIVGYLTVAGANWTGKYPVAGRPIVALLLLWLAGRFAMLFLPWIGPVSAALIDGAFLLLFALALLREQFAASNWRSLPPAIIVSALALANICWHVGSFHPALTPYVERASIALISFLIVLMGGRLVPSFTANYLMLNKITPPPAPPGLFDRLVLAISAVGLIDWVVQSDARWAGIPLLLAGLGHMVRLARWRGHKVAHDAMLLILHAGYFWVALGLALLGASMLWPDSVAQSGAVHALTSGGIGVMTLGLMTRTSRSHTGRPRRADRATIAIYIAVNLATMLRVAAPFTLGHAPGHYGHLLGASGILWTIAFGLFAASYGPMLCGQKLGARF